MHFVSTANLLVFISNIFCVCVCVCVWGGGGGWGVLIETGGLLNLARTMVSVLHKELECKVEKLKYKISEVMQLRIENKSELPVSAGINSPGSVHTKFYSRDLIIQSIIY